MSYTTATVTNTGPVITFTSPEIKYKEYAEKLDKHVDDLEVDIEFLNEQRKQHYYDIDFLKINVNNLLKENENKNNHIRWLEERINELEAKLNELRMS